MRTFTGSTNNDNRATKGRNKGKIMVNLKENQRDPEEIERLNDQYVANGMPPKYDISKAHLNIYYENCLTEEEAFKAVFGDAMAEFNSKQTRSDRKTSIEKELEKLSKGKVQQELIHCMVVQVGNHDNHPPADECIEILQEYYVEFKERFPNMRVINAALHIDEQEDGTIHLQMYYIPVKTKEQHEAMQTGKKWSGMDVQPSLTGALEQMGYSNDATVLVPQKGEDGEPILDENGNPKMVQKHDYKNGAMAQWQKDYNGLLDEICLNHDIVIDHYMRGKKVTHQDTYDYYTGKIGKETKRAKHDQKIAEGNLSETFLEVENAREERQKLQAENKALQSDNDALQSKNDALESNIRALKSDEKSLLNNIEATEQRAEKNALRKADEYIAYYKRDRTKIEKDPKVYAAFERARKSSKRVQYAWSKYRKCLTNSGRRRWAKKAISLQEDANFAWEEAKNYAEYAKLDAALRRKKAEVKKEINDLLNPHVADFKNFCRIFEALSEEKQAKYRAQFEETRKKNKGDIKAMHKHLTRIFGEKSAMEYDKIKEVQADRRAMNKLANRMLADVGKAESGGDEKDLFDMLADYDKEQAKKSPRKTAAMGQKSELESLLEEEGWERD